MHREVALAALVMPVFLTFMGLTAIGQRRRGHGVAVSFAAGIFFPVTWAVWYVRDEHPYRTAHGA